MQNDIRPFGQYNRARGDEFSNPIFLKTKFQTEKNFFFNIFFLIQSIYLLPVYIARPKTLCIISIIVLLYYLFESTFACFIVIVIIINSQNICNEMILCEVFYQKMKILLERKLSKILLEIVTFINCSFSNYTLGIIVYYSLCYIEINHLNYILLYVHVSTLDKT